MCQVMRGTHGSTWGPLLIDIFGLGMLGAGIFTADPSLGYPPGTPETSNAISTHGLIHFMVASISFAGLIAAGFVWTRRFAAQHRTGWAAYSFISALIFLISFVALASGQLFLTPAFVLTALNGFIWVSVVAGDL